MRQYVTDVILPYAERCIKKYELHNDSKIILFLDVWSVHTSEEFRTYLRMHHPRIHLVFVPPNCTKKLQPVDVALQRPFKEGIRRRFNLWSAEVVKKQVEDNKVVGLADYFKLGTLKPLILQWCIESGNDLGMDKLSISNGWYKAVRGLYDVMDPVKRVEAMGLVAKKELEVVDVPQEVEQDGDGEVVEEEDSEEDEDAEEDELDLSKPIREGERKSTRMRYQPKPFHYGINSSRIVFTSDSDQ